MSNANAASTSNRIKVGLFSLGGLIFMGILTVYVNNRPFWWRECEPVQVTVEDATGLKQKSPVKSLGLEIGYISEIGLVSNGVKLKICITAPVEVGPETKAYVRGEGFLGDRFLELKPVKYTGSHKMEEGLTPPTGNEPAESPTPAPKHAFNLYDLLIPTAFAEDPQGGGEGADSTQPRVPTKSKNGRDIPVAEKAADMQQVMTQMNGLMKDLKSAINPEEIRGTIRQLNKTLEEAAKAFSPQGGLTATAQRSLIKLEDAIEQLRDQVTRINQGQGSVGMVLNDPTYAEELKKALINMNHLLNRVGEIKLTVSLGIKELTAYQATRAEFQVLIYPKPDRFYLLGVASDPRGSVSQTTTTTVGGGAGPTTLQNTQVSKGGFALTAMVGKVFHPRIELAVGLLHGDGAAALGINLGPYDNLNLLQLKNELYFRTNTDGGTWTAQPDGRIYLIYQPYSILFLTAGMDGFRKVGGQTSAFYGAGIRFEDEDIRMLFSFL